MATHLCASAFILRLILALYFVSMARGDIRDIVTRDIFNTIVYGYVTLHITPQDLFDGMLSSVFDGCAGKKFYTYNDFINASNAFSGFGRTGTSADNKREIAAFFANVARETGSLCYIEQIDKSNSYCDSSNTKYLCGTGKQYYGRGPLQLKWNYNYGTAGDYLGFDGLNNPICSRNYNYGTAGDYLGFDGLNNPDIVAQDDSVSWMTAVWFWMVGSNCHTAITSGQGFGATIKAMNRGECNGDNSEAVTQRVNYYQSFCNQFGVDPGSNVSC